MSRIRLVFAAVYIVLILVLWWPVGSRHLLGFTNVQPYCDHPVRSILLVPSIPFTYTCEYIRPGISHALIASLYPLYLAVFLWPLGLAAHNPAAFRRVFTQFVLISYLALVVVLMLISCRVLCMVWTSRNYQPSDPSPVEIGPGQAR